MQAPPRLDSSVTTEGIPLLPEEAGGLQSEGAVGDEPIPTAEMIRLAKERRKQARERGEYIPLDDSEPGQG